MANVLFIDGTLPSFPQPNRDWRVLRVLKALVEAGHRVVYLLLRGERHEIYRPAFKEVGVELCLEKRAWAGRKSLPGCPVVELAQLLQDTYFHLACVHFVQNALPCIPIIRRHSPGTRIAVDTVDLAHLRLWRESLVTGLQELTVQAYRAYEREVAAFRRADLVIAISPLEEKIIARMAPGIRTTVIPVMADPWPEVKPYAGRQGLLYLGSFFHRPNVDAVLYLIRYIWPRIQQLLPGATLHIVGHGLPEEIRALAGDGVRVHGYVPSRQSYFERCRLMVAPIRYGAGIKTKIVEAMAAGLPVVTTSIGAEGMDIVPGENALVADSPMAFARAVAEVYLNEGLWNRLSRGGQDLVRRRYSFPAVAPAIYGLLKE